MTELNSKNTDYLSEEKKINRDKIIELGEINKDKRLKINVKKNIIRRNNILNDFGLQLKYSKKLIIM